MNTATGIPPAAVRPGPAQGVPRSLCFVSPFGYLLLAGDRSTPLAGGAEVQQATLAREFVRRGWRVSMVSMDFGQPDSVIVDGVTVHRMYALTAGIPGLRFFHPRLTSLWRALRRADADVYYQRIGSALTGQVAAFARVHQRNFVFAAASDMDFASGLPFIPLARDRWLYTWGIARANAVVVQSPTQRVACAAAFGHDAHVVRSCYGHAGAPARHDGVVLWVGTLKSLKRPELFVELARRLPQYRFRMVGGNRLDSQDAREASLHALGAGLGNIEFTGFVPFVDVEAQFDGAALLVNTSVAEGFPNTFLQAWSRGMPTVSFFDPGAQIEGRMVGTVATSIDDMAQAIDALMQSNADWQQRSQDAVRYFQQNFSVGAAVDAYEAVFATLPAARGVAMREAA